MKSRRQVFGGETHCMMSDQTCKTTNPVLDQPVSSCRTRGVKRKRQRRLLHNAPSKERHPQTCPLPTLFICFSSY